MKKQSRKVIARKKAVSGTYSSKTSSASGISKLKAQYVAAMNKLSEIDKDEIRSLAAITERLSKAQ